MDEQYLRINEVCDIMKISKATLYRMIRAEDFPAPTKLGKRKSRWHVKTVEAWVDKQEGTYGNA